MKILMLSLLAASLLSGCASLLPPSADEVARLPVVSYGQPRPASGDFILRYPAGQDLPVNAKIEGNLLEQAVSSPLTVRVKQDVYSYGQFLSLDGKTWQRISSALDVQVRVTPPGQKDGQVEPQAAGEVRTSFNLKP